MHMLVVAASTTTQEQNASGLVGLGPNSGSRVYSELGSNAGDAIVDRIFRQNTSSPNFITALLGRSDDPDHPYPGSFSVGEVISGYENVTSQPKLPVTSVSNDNSSVQHWQVLLDSDGIIGPNGKPIKISTQVSSTSDKTQLTAVFDTGYSLPQVPKYVSGSFACLAEHDNH